MIVQFVIQQSTQKNKKKEGAKESKRSLLTALYCVNMY